MTIKKKKKYISVSLKLTEERKKADRPLFRTLFETISSVKIGAHSQIDGGVT